MKAVIIEKTGGPEVLKYTTEAAAPSPKDGEVLIQNHIAGINYIDTYFRTGLYPSASGYPMILGQEASGVVAGLGEGGDKHGLKEGDRVVWIKQGGYAEYTTVNADKVVKIPDGISDEDAVGGFLMGMTALSLVQESYPVKKGDWVLVHAAAGGVGLLMCQILRSMGARLIGTAGGPEKCALAKENGAEFMIDYKKTDGPGWLEQVKEITKGEGVAVVYDSVGKDTWEQSLQAIRRKGKVSILFHPPHSRQSTNKFRWCTSVPHPAPCHLSPLQS
jgi:NADPH:quinone reductase